MTTVLPRREHRALRTVVVAMTIVVAVLIADAVRSDASVDWPGGAASVVVNALTATVWLAAASITAWARPRSPFGWLLFIGAVCLALSGALTGEGAVLAASGSALGAWWGWIGGWIFFPQLSVAAIIYLLFPDGRLRRPWWRVWVVVAIVAGAGAAAVVAVAPGALATEGPLSLVDNPLGATGVGQALLPLCVGLLNVAFLAGIVNLFLRRRRAAPRERRVLTLVAGFACVNLVVGFLAIDPPGDWVYLLTVPVTIGLTGSIVAGIVWGGLWDVRRTVGRVLAAAILTGVVIAVFILIVTAAAALTGSQLLGVALAALVVCLLLVPVQSWLRQAIDGLLYGRRRQPYEVLSEFGTALETAGGPVDGLQRLTELAVSNLRLPGVAIELTGVGGRPAASGAVIDDATCVRFPIRYHGAAVGWLLVTPRSGESDFDDVDRRLLEDLARQAAAAVNGVASTEALREHRAELVSVREEERRRLRRDLHDGVASGITALGLTTEVAEDALTEDPAKSARLLKSARLEIATVLADLRRVIEGLGPSMLVDLGMKDSAAVLASRFTTDDLKVTCVVDPELPDLSASAEEAAFWILTESLQNVARHSGASECTVSLSWDGQSLTLVIEDDGRGIVSSSHPGLGLDSIRLRAEEIGGTAAIEARQPTGTRVVAHLPAEVAVRGKATE